MFDRCIFCHAALAHNQSLQHFRHGRRIAFDPVRGRLWAVCQACGRWNLAPIEERWEALEELDRLSTDRARLLSQTDNIALMRVDDLQLVRVGRAERAEEAWWRYGRDLLQRRRRSHIIQGLEVAAMIAAAAATGGAAVGMVGSSVFLPVTRWWRFGRVAWRGQAACERCGTPLRQLRFRDAGALVLRPGDDGGMEVWSGCERCGTAHGGVGHRLTGMEAEHVVRRSLAWMHHVGASEQRVRSAASAIEAAGSAERLVRAVAERRVTLDRLETVDRAHAVALEIAVNEERERQLLELELAQLERRWKEEEEIAAIADRELVFLPFLPGRRVGPPSGTSIETSIDTSIETSIEE